MSMSMLLFCFLSTRSRVQSLNEFVYKLNLTYFNFDRKGDIALLHKLDLF